MTYYSYNPPLVLKAIFIHLPFSFSILMPTPKANLREKQRTIEFNHHVIKASDGVLILDDDVVNDSTINIYYHGAMFFTLEGMELNKS